MTILLIAAVLGLPLVGVYVLFSRKRGLGEKLTAVGVILVCGTIIAPIAREMFLANRASTESNCLSNLKDFAVASLQYAGDWDDHFPAQGGLGALRTYGATESNYHCPAARSPFGYAMNAGATGSKTASIPKPEQTVFAFESDAATTSVTGNATLLPPKPRHRDADVFAFVDGHAGRVRRGQESNLIWSPVFRNPIRETPVTTAR